MRIWEEGDLQTTYKELHSVLDLPSASLPPLEGPFSLNKLFLLLLSTHLVQTFVEGLKCLEMPMGAPQTPLTAGSSSNKLAPSSQKTPTVSIDVISKMWAGEMTCGYEDSTSGPQH